MAELPLLLARQCETIRVGGIYVRHKENASRA